MKKKLKKIKLNAEIITELTKDETRELQGGGIGFPTISTVGGFTYNTWCSYGDKCVTDNCGTVVV